MGDESVIIDFIGNTQEVDKKTQKLNQDFDKLKSKVGDKAAEGKGLDLSFQGVLMKVGATAGALATVQAGVSVVTGLMAGFEASTARANGEWERMLKLEEQFKGSFEQIPIIGSRIIAPIWRMVDLLTGAQQRVERIMRHAQEVKGITQSLTQVSRQLDAQVKTIGLDEFAMRLHSAQTKAAEFAADEMKRFQDRVKELNDTKPKSGSALVEWNKMMAENVNAVKQIESTRQRIRQIELASIRADEWKRHSEATRETERAQDIAAMEEYGRRRGAKLFAPGPNQFKLAESLAKETKAIREVEVAGTKQREELTKRLNNLAKVAAMEGKTFNVQAAFRRELGVLDDQMRTKIDAIKQQYATERASITDAAPELEYGASRQRLKDEILAMELRRKSRDLDASILEIESRYADQIKNTADEEAKRLLLKKQELEVSKAIKDANLGRFTMGDIWSRAGSREPQSVIRNAREGDIRQTKEGGFEKFTGNDWAAMFNRKQDRYGNPTASMERLIRESVARGSSRVFSPTGKQMSTDEVYAALGARGGNQMAETEKATKMTASNTSRMVDILGRLNSGYAE